MTRHSAGVDDFEAVFRQVWPAAFAVACRVLGDWAEAEDAAAEGFARALVAWPRVGGLSYRDAWILRVVGNVAIDRARRQARAGHGALAPSADGTDHQDLTVLRMALVEALAALPTRQREVIVLRHLCGMSEHETAGAMGISGNSVKKHTSRGIARLRAKLGTSEGEAELAF